MERALVPFTIPLTGSKRGVSTFDFLLDREFFACFQESPVEDGALSVTVSLDKRPDVYLFHAELEGRLATTCDRCTADIRLPVQGEYELIVKFGEAPDEDDEVVVLPADTTEFNISRFLYECAVLSLPVRRVYDCQADEPRPCDMDVLRFLHQTSDQPEEPTPGMNHPFGDLLDQLNKN